VRFTEINVLGVYVAPMSLMMVAAWLVTITLRRVVARFGLLPPQLSPHANIDARRFETVDASYG